MYGFTPSATTEKVVRPPPLNRSSRPNTGLDPRKAARAVRSTPGTGTWASSRKTSRIPATYRIRRRRSGARNALRMASNTGG